MKTVLIALGLLLTFTVVAAALGPKPDAAVGSSGQTAVVENLENQQMLDGHGGMMDQMRASATPQMTNLMPADWMWQTLSPEMIQLMEQNQ
ncbi:MAG: hypothetical protein ACR2NT_11380 [Acidimicrobiia bacterium]